MLRTYPDLFFVAIDPNADRVIGYIMNKIDKGYSFFLPKKEIVQKGHVFSVGVLHEYRRKGIASALLALAYDAMIRKREVKEIFLEVRVSNAPAIKLYEKFGMEIVSSIPFYYADGETAYVMAVKSEDVIDIVDRIMDYLKSHGYIKEVVYP